MDLLGQIEWWVGQLGGVAIAGTLGVIFAGIFRGINRFQEEPVPQKPGVFLKPIYYGMIGSAFLIFCWWIWLPLTANPPTWLRIIGLVIGIPLLFGGIGLIIWGRLALRLEYFVSTSRSAHLFSDHRLVTTGPYAIVRHPMYLGILMVGIGGTLFYRTWTMVFISLMYLGLRIRARREEEALADVLGEQWQKYQRSVPAWLPRRKIS